MTPKTFGVWAVLITVVLAVSSARAQTDTGGGMTAPADSTVPQITGYRFSPVYLNSINGSVNNVDMRNAFQSSLLTPFGAIMSFQISKEKTYYRLNNKFDDKRNLSLSMLHTFRPGLNGSAGYTDNRVFNRSIAPGGATQEFIFNDKALNAGATYKRDIRAARMDWAAATSLVDGERSFKSDQTFALGTNGGVGYTLPGGRVAVLARGAYRATDNQSYSGGKDYRGLGSNEDSLSTAVHVSVADSVGFRADYTTYHGDRDYLDQAVGSSGGQLIGEQNVIKENETHNTHSTLFAFDAVFSPRLGLSVSASHDEQLYTYMTQVTRNSHTVGDEAKGTLTYTTPWNTVSTFQLSNSVTLHDFGKQSISSTKDKVKRVSLALNQNFTKTLSGGINLSTQLLQTYYLDYADNPRDRDQVDENVNAHLTSQLFKKLSANVTVSYSMTRYINIDSTQSVHNRSRELYQLRPGFSYNMTNWLTISQTYGLTIEYTKYVYTQEDNFLDRNITLSNVFNFRPTKSVAFNLNYQLTLHDNGSYLPTGANGENLLNIAHTDRRDRMNLRVDYNVNDRVGIFAENTYTHFLNREEGTGRETITTDGQIKVGTQGAYAWGAGRTLKFHLAKVKRFSPYGTDKDKNFWDMGSELNFPF